VVARAAVLQREWQLDTQPGVPHLLRDARLLEAHTAMLPPPRRPRVDPIDVALVLGRAKVEEAETLEGALRTLSTPELAAVLGDAAALQCLSTLTRC
jgi:membrane glycosyltransferase